jgi:hypothetical protein
MQIPGPPKIAALLMGRDRRWHNPDFAICRVAKEVAMLNDPVIATVTRLRMDLETARAALARAHQRLGDLEGQDLSREQLSAFIGNHGLDSLVAEVVNLGQAIAAKTS